MQFRDIIFCKVSYFTEYDFKIRVCCCAAITMEYSDLINQNVEQIMGIFIKNVFYLFMDNCILIIFVAISIDCGLGLDHWFMSELKK